jgi:hypothetical protein
MNEHVEPLTAARVAEAIERRWGQQPENVREHPVAKYGWIWDWPQPRTSETRGLPSFGNENEIRGWLCGDDVEDKHTRMLGAVTSSLLMRFPPESGPPPLREVISEVLHAVCVEIRRVEGRWAVPE